jgi:transcriptional regulator with XRE-family HTH domain
MTGYPELARALAGLHRHSTAQELRAVYEQGATVQQLVTATGRSVGWVRGRLRGAGTRMRPPGRNVRVPAPGAGADTERGPSPTVLRHVLARRLTELRAHAQLTQGEAARKVGVSLATLMRAENPQGPLKLDVLRGLCALYGTAPHVCEELLALWRGGRAPEWWTIHDLDVSEGQRTAVGLRGDARRVYGWAETLVPELIQTPGYARVVEGAFDTGSVEMAVSVRLAAQRRVRRRGIDQRYVLDEGVIRRRVGGPQVMAEQLSVLRTLAARGRVRVLSWESGHCPLPEPVELCSIPGLTDTALYWPRTRGIHIGDPPPPAPALRFFQDRLAQLWEWAQDTNTTLAMLDHARADLRQTRPAPRAHQSSPHRGTRMTQPPPPPDAAGAPRPLRSGR